MLEKYIRKADLAAMNQTGIQFLKDGKAVAFSEVQVSASGFLYCEEEELMFGVHHQEEYDKKACIWNAFEEDDMGWVAFRTADFNQVDFTFGVNTANANKTIPPYRLVLGEESIDLDLRRHPKSSEILIMKNGRWL